jgi:hypothetical protein
LTFLPDPDPYVTRRSSRPGLPLRGWVGPPATGMLQTMLARTTPRHGSALTAALGAACLALALGAGGAHAADGDIATVAGGSAASGTPAQRAELRHPRRVAFLPGGALLVVEFGQAGGEPNYGDGRIRRVSASGQITAFAGTGVEGFSGDGGPATEAEFNGPTDLIVTPEGDVLVADEFNHRIRRIASDGTISTVAGDGDDDCEVLSGPASAAAFSWPRALALDPEGGYFILDEHCAMVHRVDPGADERAGTADDTITTIAGTGATGFFGDNGPAVDATFNNPRGLAATSGSVLVADSLNQRVRRIDRDTGRVTTVAGTGTVPGPVGDGGAATAAYLELPRDVEAVAGGGFLIADSRSNRVRRVLPDGTIVTIAGNGNFGVTGDGGPATDARLSEPFGVNLSPAGDLYISGAGVAGTSTANQRVRVVTDALDEIPEPEPEPTTPTEPTPPGIEPTSPDESVTPPPAAPQTPAPPGPATIVGPPLIAAPPAPLRFGLVATSPRRVVAPRIVSLRIGASRAVAGRRVVVQVGTRVRVRGRLVVRYRAATAAIVRGRATGVRLRIAKSGTYLVRLSYLDAGRPRTSVPITIVARARPR